MVKDIDHFNNINIYMILNKFYLIQKFKPELKFENFLDYINSKFEDEDLITVDKFIEFLTFVSVKNVYDFMLKDAITSPEKYL